MVDSIRTILARLEERLGNISDNNKETHDKICLKLDTLTEHVNHENEKMDGRIRELESQRLIQKGINLAQGDTNLSQGVINTCSHKKKTKREVIGDNKYTIIISAIVTGIIAIIVKLSELGII